MSKWHDGRPVFNRLPLDGYQNNDAVDALTVWVDEKITSKAEQLQNFYTNYLNPDTCLSEALDYLAYLVGLSGEYWDSAWSDQVKRTFIKSAHPLLWSKRGTLAVISFILQTHGLEHQIWTDADLIMSFAMSRAFGTTKLRFFVRLSVSYPRSGLQYREAQRTLKNFAPAVVEHKACYDYFRLGLSIWSDPMFSEGTYKPVSGS